MDLNRAFYAAVANEFDRTRQGLPAGMLALAQQLFARRQLSHTTENFRILDLGCGNGRFARALAQCGVACDYIGADADTQLLAQAIEQTQNLPGVSAEFLHIDLADSNWVSQFSARSGFDAVVCLAVLHHFPGWSLRQSLIAEMSGLVQPQGILALSTWQFLDAERFVEKRTPWEAIGLTAADVESGDALLPWNQGVQALRYVHQLDRAEIQAMANAEGLEIIESFRADGKEGNLNLFVILQHPLDQPHPKIN
ncbi:MAG: methyltransferase domain-containing protein [Anaerolineales bacterium]|nr:methyltransferase domain-containing protein [Anaerolineales bacterium]